MITKKEIDKTNAVSNAILFPNYWGTSQKTINKIAKILKKELPRWANYYRYELKDEKN